MNNESVYDSGRIAAIKTLPVYFGAFLSCFVTTLLTLYLCWSISDDWFTRTVFVAGGAAIQLAIFLCWPEIRRRWSSGDVFGVLRIAAFLACLEAISLVASVSGLNAGLSAGQVDYDNVIAARSSIESRIAGLQATIDENDASIVRLRELDRISRDGGVTDLNNQNLATNREIAELQDQLVAMPMPELPAADVIEQSFGSVALVVILLSVAFDAVCAFFIGRLQDCFSEPGNAAVVEEDPVAPAMKEQPAKTVEVEHEDVGMMVACSASGSSPVRLSSEVALENTGCDDELLETVQADLISGVVNPSKGAVRKFYGIGTDRVNSIFASLVDLSVLCKTDNNRYQLQ